MYSSSLSSAAYYNRFLVNNIYKHKGKVSLQGREGKARRAKLDEIQLNPALQMELISKYHNQWTPLVELCEQQTAKEFAVRLQDLCAAVPALKSFGPQIEAASQPASYGVITANLKSLFKENGFPRPDIVRDVVDAIEVAVRPKIFFRFIDNMDKKHRPKGQYIRPPSTTQLEKDWINFVNAKISHDLTSDLTLFYFEAVAKFTETPLARLEGIREILGRQLTNKKDTPLVRAKALKVKSVKKLVCRLLREVAPSMDLSDYPCSLKERIDEEIDRLYKAQGCKNPVMRAPEKKRKRPLKKTSAPCPPKESKIVAASPIDMFDTTDAQKIVEQWDKRDVPMDVLPPPEPVSYSQISSPFNPMLPQPYPAPPVNFPQLAPSVNSESTQASFPCEIGSMCGCSADWSFYGQPQPPLMDPNIQHTCQQFPFPMRYNPPPPLPLPTPQMQHERGDEYVEVKKADLVRWLGVMQRALDPDPSNVPFPGAEQQLEFVPPAQPSQSQMYDNMQFDHFDPFYNGMGGAEFGYGWENPYVDMQYNQFPNVMGGDGMTLNPYMNGAEPMDLDGEADPPALFPREPDLPGFFR